MDADLSNRCINYYVNIINQKFKNIAAQKYLLESDVYMIINKFTPFQDYTIFYNTF